MGTIAALKRGLAKVDLPRLIVSSIESTADEYIALNQGQLKRGLDKDGDEITPGYKLIEYAIRKHEQNAAPGFGVPDLFLTGAFYRAFTIRVGFTSIFVTSLDDKTPKLSQKYGPAIFGLTPYDRTYYAKGVFYEALQKSITGATGLIFR